MNDGIIPNTSSITVTIHGDSHVKLVNKSFTVERRRYENIEWNDILVKLRPLVSYEDGYDFKSYRLEGASGMILSKNYTNPVTVDTVIYVESQKPAKKIQNGVSIILAEEKSTLKLKVKTMDNSNVKVEGATPKVIVGNGREVELTLDEKNNDKLIQIKYGDSPIIALSILDNDNITSLDVRGLNMLQELDCNGHQLSTLNLQGLSKLVKLDCSANQLTTLDIKELTKLKVCEMWAE